MALTLAAAALVLGFGPANRSLPVGLTAATLGLGGAVLIATLAARSPNTALAFRLTMVLALLDVALLIALAS